LRPSIIYLRCWNARSPAARLQLGTTKVFIRHPKVLFALEYMRTQALADLVSKVAAVWRGFAGKRNYAKIKRAWLRQQANVRAHQARKRFLRLRAAAIRIQAVT